MDTDDLTEMAYQTIFLAAMASDYLKAEVGAMSAKFSNEDDYLNGNKVRAHRIVMEDDLFGIIVEVRFGRKKYYFPLNELEALDKESANYQLLERYAWWSPEKKSLQIQVTIYYQPLERPAGNSKSEPAARGPLRVQNSNLSNMLLGTLQVPLVSPK